jgi:hypothetical protein
MSTPPDTMLVRVTAIRVTITELRNIARFPVHKRKLHLKKFMILTLALTFLTPLALAHGYGHVMGTVKDIDGDTLVMTSIEGTEVSVELTAETKVRRGKQEVSRDAIESGIRAVVHYAKDKTAAEIELPAEKS